MSDSLFKGGVVVSALVFLAVFLFICLPALIALEGSLIENSISAFSAGFVNPFAIGFSVDATACWFILLFWVLHEAKNQNIKYGWVCLLIGAFPGIAVGFAAYLLLRHKQLAQQAIA
jgi:Protein of unknown function DUF2834